MMVSGIKLFINSVKVFYIGNLGSKVEFLDFFFVVDKEIDGEDCDCDCSNCVVQYLKLFKIDEIDVFYGFVKGWSMYVLVVMGKLDWVCDVVDEKGSIMQVILYVKVFSNGVCF